MPLKKSSQETNFESLFNICRSIFGLCLTDKARRRNIYGASQEGHINPQQHKEEVAISSGCNANVNVKAFSSQLQNLRSPLAECALILVDVRYI